MTHLPVRYSDFARANLDEAACVLNARHPQLGEALVLAVRQALNTVSVFPLIYNEVRPDVRRIVLRTYHFNVYYRLHADFIEVLAVLHASANPNAVDRL